MHRNTYILISILAVVAALVIGVNIGKKFSKTPEVVPVSVTPTPTQTPIKLETYSDPYCGISFSYPSTLSVLDSASGSALLTNAKDTSESVAVACQDEIPRPPLVAEKIESLILPDGEATIAAKLYHDASPKDGSPIDALIFRHPKKKMDVFIAGFGETFNELIKTVQLLP